MSLASITLLVDDKLRIEALGSLAPTDARDRAVAQALLQYAADKPLTLSAVVLAGGDAFAVPPGWVDHQSTLVAVEYPIGRAPMASLQALAARDAANVPRILLLVDSLQADTAVRVHFTAPHAADGSSIPASHENAIACWAAAELCRQAATRAGHDRDATISAANVSTQSQSGELARRARDWLAQYRSMLGLPDPEARKGGEASGTVVSWGGDGHRRARFNSQGL